MIRKQYSSENGEGYADNTASMTAPIVIIPKFHLADNTLTTLSKAIVSISKGRTVGEHLELDANYTLVNNEGQTHIENTNIHLPHGGYNARTGQLILEGEDSVSSYEELLESILLETRDHFQHEQYTISFTLVDNEGHQHRLPPTIIDISKHRNTVFEEVFATNEESNITYLSSDTDITISTLLYDEPHYLTASNQDIGLFNEEDTDAWILDLIKENHTYYGTQETQPYYGHYAMNLMSQSYSNDNEFDNITVLSQL